MSAARTIHTQQIVDKLDELPTLPSIVYELNRVINDPMSSTSDIERLMANDPSLTTKVLRLANSAYYAIPGGVSNLQRAIAYIGYDTIQQLVLSASIIEALDGKFSGPFDLNQFWKHSVGVAMAAETTARYVHYKTPADLFTCGLVHDMGKIAMYNVAQEEFLGILEVARENNLSITEAEERVGALGHAQIGFELSLKWRLPTLIQASVMNHHRVDSRLRGAISSEMNLVVDIVFLSNLLIHALEFGNSGHSKSLGAPKELLERMSLSQENLKDLIRRIRESIANADGFLKIIGG